MIRFILQHYNTSIEKMQTNVQKFISVYSDKCEKFKKYVDICNWISI